MGTTRANHVVAAMAFDDWTVAGWARRGVFLDVLFVGNLFVGKFTILGLANLKIAVP